MYMYMYLCYAIVSGIIPVTCFNTLVIWYSVADNAIIRRTAFLSHTLMQHFCSLLVELYLADFLVQVLSLLLRLETHAALKLYCMRKLGTDCSRYDRRWTKTPISHTTGGSIYKNLHLVLKKE